MSDHAQMPAIPNPKYEAFAQALATGASASAAYVTAGYKPHGSNASRLSQHDSVRARVEELQRAGAEQAGVTIERIVRGLSDIAFGTAPDWKSSAKDSDRISALEKLGKHLGMFKDRVEHSGRLEATLIYMPTNGRD